MGYGDKSGFLQPHRDLKADYYKFNTKVVAVLAALAGSGAFGFKYISSELYEEQNSKK